MTSGGKRTQSEERAAQNEVSFRDANETIDRKRRELELDGLTPFLCECSDPACTELVRLSPGEYKRVRSQATWFVVADARHEQGGAEIVDEHDRYVIVAKDGLAGRIAEGEDPRQ